MGFANLVTSVSLSTTVIHPKQRLALSTTVIHPKQRLAEDASGVILLITSLRIARPQTRRTGN
jgi:hypothetical protein